MRALLDTHCWLWMQVSPQRLSAEARDLVSDLENELYFSVASGWEIAIKYALGRLPLPDPPEQYIPRALERQRIETLPVELRHALRVSGLPTHHRDPFDRLLIAQALTEDLTLLTVDRQFVHHPEREPHRRAAHHGNLAFLTRGLRSLRRSRRRDRSRCRPDGH